MNTYTWEFGSDQTSLHFTVTYDADTQSFSVQSLSGSFDLNALWFSNGDIDALDSDGYTLSKSDSSLNMNGSTTVWNDDGTVSSEKIVWDDMAKVSSTGLGSAGTEKLSFVSEGQTVSLSLEDLGLTDFDPDLLGVLGVRATSVNGTDGIKWADKSAVITAANHAPTAEAITWNVTEYDEHATGADTSGAPVNESVNLITAALASDPDGDPLSVVENSLKIDNGDGTTRDLPDYLSVDASGNLSIETNSTEFDALYRGDALPLKIVYQITDGTSTIDNAVDLTVTGTADQFANDVSTSGMTITSFNTTTWDGSFNFVLNGAPADAFDFSGTATVTVAGDIDGVNQREYVNVAFEGGDFATVGGTTSGNKEPGNPNYPIGGYLDTDYVDFASSDSTVNGSYDSTTLNGADGVDKLVSIGVTVSSYDYWM